MFTCFRRCGDGLIPLTLLHGDLSDEIEAARDQFPQMISSRKLKGLLGVWPRDSQLARQRDNLGQRPVGFGNGHPVVGFFHHRQRLDDQRLRRGQIPRLFAGHMRQPHEGTCFQDRRSYDLGIGALRLVDRASLLPGSMPFIGASKLRIQSLLVCC